MQTDLVRNRGPTLQQRIQNRGPTGSITSKAAGKPGHLYNFLLVKLHLLERRLRSHGKEIWEVPREFSKSLEPVKDQRMGDCFGRRLLPESSFIYAVSLS